MTHLNDYLIPCKNEDLAKAWTDGDPLGNGLPEVTSSDNGKVLTVIDGSWGAGVASGGGILKVTLTVTENEADGSTIYIYTLDRTWTEIRDALNLGYYVCAVDVDHETNGVYQYDIIAANIEHQEYSVRCDRIGTFTSSSVDGILTYILSEA